MPDPFGEENLSQIGNYLFSSITTIPVYLIYSFPAIIVYGLAISVISDKAGEAILAKTQNKRTELIVSGVMHIVFGLIFFWFSLSASVLFFITDRILKYLHYEYQWRQAVASLAIPSVTWSLCMAVVWWSDSV
jgi:hypothetical protein